MHTDLTFFTNEEENSLYKRFRSTLREAKFFDVLVGYFRTSGFYRLYDAFENIEKIRILVGINSDYKTFEILEEAKQQKLDFETHSNTKKIFSDNLVNEFIHSEDKYEVEQGVKKFIELINSGKLEIKAFPSRSIHAKVYISRYESNLLYGSVVTGSSNFSEAGLNGNYEFNVELKNKADVDYALDKFNKLWAQAVELSEEYIDTVNKKTWLNDNITPYELYLKLLYEYFNEEINAADTEQIMLPEGFMKLEYQEQAVTTLRKIIDSYNGAFISDVVGLGKTYMTAMYAQGLPGRKLVICPPPILDNWKEAFISFGVRSYEIESIGKLDKIIKKIKRSGKNNYDYIFVDEAHRFRNEDTEQYSLLHEICLNKKVLLITATPLNNTFYDFYSLIKLFQRPANSDIPGSPDLRLFFTSKKSKLKKYEETYGKNSTAYLNEVKQVAKEVREKILKHVMLRRTRTDIVNCYDKDIKQQGLFFPKVADPRRIVYEFDKKTSAIFDQTIDVIKHLTYARYTPLLYLKEEQLSAFEKQHEANLKGFMKTRLVKRLESSKHAFEMTISRFIDSHEKFIKMFNNGTVYISKKVNVYDYLDSDNEDKLDDFLTGDDSAKVKRYSSDQFNDDFLANLQTDLDELKTLHNQWKGIKTDFKLEKFLSELKADNLLAKNKLVIFTESKETGDDIFKAVSKEYPRSVIFFSSSSGINSEGYLTKETAKEIIKDNYDPNSPVQKDDIRILITTDVLSEGINLHKSNIIINYDLPWNPTRVLQRVGRINRVGTKHKEIFIYNFFPTSEADAHLGLEDNIKSKIQAFHNALGEDAKYLTDEEEFASFELRGAEHYDRVNSIKTYENDGEENIELKYLKIIRDIRDNDVNLFHKIKKLPKKIRACRYYKDIDKHNLATFFRKGKLKKFCITDGMKSEEIAFDEAVKYFECECSAKKENIPKEYYDYLEINKKQFISPQEDEEESEFKTKGGKSTEKAVIMHLKAVQRDKRLTEDEAEYIKSVLKAYSEGVIPKKTSRTIKEKIEKITDNLKIVPLLKSIISNEYLQGKSSPDDKPKATREIILSEFLKKS